MEDQLREFKIGNGEDQVGEEFDLLNPLLITVVAQAIFSSLGRKGLLTVRRVCKLWYTLGTEEYLSRKNIKEPVCMCTVEHDEWKSVAEFMSIVASSPRVPIARFKVRLNLVSFSVRALYSFLTFIAPMVRELEWDMAGVTQPVDPLQKKHVNKLIRDMRSWDDEHLKMPNLEELSVSTTFRAVPQSFGDVLLALITRILKGASNLKSFGGAFEYLSLGEPMQLGILDTRTLFRSLPVTLRRLQFNGKNKVSAPYDALLTSGLELEELLEVGSDWDGSGTTVTCLDSHKDTLRLILLCEMEDLYRQSYPAFPVLRFVKTLYTVVSCVSNFDFVSALPNLVQLTVRVEGIADDPDPEKKLEDLTPHPSVRKLTVGSPRFFRGREIIQFDRLAQSFPNVSHLTFYSPEREVWVNLVDLYNHFPKIEFLYLPFFVIGRPISLESLLTGFSLRVCRALKEFDGLIDDDDIQNVIGMETCVAGMISLTRLKVLEIAAREDQWMDIFTNLTVHQVFMKMESLREIRFVWEEEIPEAARPFQQRLREKGIDFFRMKKDGVGGLQLFL